MSIDTIYDAIREVKSNPKSFASLPDEYKSDYVVQKAAVLADGTNLQYCSDELKANRNFVEMAVQSNPDAILYAAPHISDEMLMSKGTLFFSVDKETNEQNINIKWKTPDQKEQIFTFNADNLDNFETGYYYNEEIPANDIKDFIEIVTEQVNNLPATPPQTFLKDVCDILNEAVYEPERKYYIPEYDINGTADELFIEASDFYDTCSVEKLEMIAKILNDEAIQNGDSSFSEKAILVQAIADCESVDKSTLECPNLNIAQMKVDLLRYDNIFDIDDIGFNDDGNLHLTVMVDRGDVAIYFRGEVESGKTITTLENSLSVPKDDFLAMSQKDFDRTIGEMINTSREVEVTKKHDKERDIDR